MIRRVGSFHSTRCQMADLSAFVLLTGSRLTPSYIKCGSPTLCSAPHSPHFEVSRSRLHQPLNYLEMALSFLGTLPEGHEDFIDPHRWIAPGPGDMRSPCPAMNTLGTNILLLFAHYQPLILYFSQVSFLFSFIDHARLLTDSTRVSSAIPVMDTCEHVCLPNRVAPSLTDHLYRLQCSRRKRIDISRAHSRPDRGVQS